jgi:hypothetical protein
MRTKFGRKGVAIAAGSVLLISFACTPAGMSVLPRTVTEQKCRTFVITPNVPITINGDIAARIPLGGNNFIIVQRGTLPAGTIRRYVGNPLDDHDGRRAGIRIEPTDRGVPIQFLKDVELHLSYDGCAEFEDKDEPFVLVKTDSTGKRVIGSEKMPAQKRVRARLRSFSEFAIAI